MGKKTSVWLSDELLSGWHASRLPLAELVRRGLEMDAPNGPLDESTLRRVVREIIRDELAGLSVAADRAPSGYGARDYGAGDFGRERYIEDP